VTESHIAFRESVDGDYVTTHAEYTPGHPDGFIEIYGLKDEEYPEYVSTSARNAPYFSFSGH